ncbi:hypothetical protein CHS0354_023805 [Potamilus streckersoni]|uniref:Lipid/polyisoprenoid-binding YceI-like domain-containing protein n=1 Tax=Potamilus streckersoni TaxID=2493646 RepID=A0AAE0RZ44_9BIVA|nr:hypothetical protein CHS0354_023805 [Potamilus streckersoni]
MILGRVLISVLLLCYGAGGGYSKTPSPVSKFPDLNHLVIMIKGGGLVPFRYSTNPIQWVGYLQGSYAVTSIFAVEADLGIGSKNYRVSGSVRTDSIDALKDERMIYAGIAFRWKAIRLNDNVKGVFLIGGHYLREDAGFDLGFQLESRTGKIVSAFIFVAFIATDLKAQWKVDAIHSTVNFSVSHMVVSDAVGRFTAFSGTVSSIKEDFTDAKILFEIEASSVDTDNLKRDEHLKAKDFFDVGTYPKIKFESTEFKKITDKKYKLTGKLNFHGVEKVVIWDVDFKGIVKGQQAKIAGFKCVTTINRQDFGVSWSKTMDAGGLVLGNDVTLTVYVELNQIN